MNPFLKIMQGFSFLKKEIRVRPYGSSWHISLTWVAFEKK
ncbi:hypothetical protein LEP1GSC151_1216 [Leptospira interrogans serovar Grippotyphosa str. LT2186]|uniref:Uncharacterized protein n=1 Tax=Leptospira interrogans serovar Grippotyphosa str. LT2186 TaxID=1001599 RepID=M3HHH4_LEPIR|nr:hypothetical protein LEP1GSC080_2538 [Leptospira interrogans str. FPW2026]EKO88557.1 hypothetical protein LEP1GSC009_1074 [Leptospira interrogans serovar Grippotyphosa str. Andaman]EKP84242.1 hypothetical protein LEP1GSC020_4404 [Leptospira interrogans serovar Grippotyphosa str. 2006006986]EKR45222.1 hypothetical protein LEP1GSC097_3351 [Leptospira interrogans serovar Grippotyphosa str. UI 08368]EMG12100.1 hypothetical protein LEP1GSC151_1216 [Leptospira interrogans serovar Grippotyphosa str